MTATICFLAWIYSMLSDKNKSTGLVVVCFIAWLAALIGV